MALWILPFAAQYFSCTHLSLINIELIKLTDLSILLMDYSSILHLLELSTKKYLYRLYRFVRIHMTLLIFYAFTYQSIFGKSWISTWMHLNVNASFEITFSSLIPINCFLFYPKQINSTEQRYFNLHI